MMYAAEPDPDHRQIRDLCGRNGFSGTLGAQFCKAASKQSTVSRQYTKSDRFFAQLDRALRTSSGSTGRPSTPAKGERSRSAGDDHALRQAHAALTIQTGLQAGASAPGQSPSGARQNAQRTAHTETALREITLTMQRTGVSPSLVAPVLYASAVGTGLFTALTGDSATRALHADSRRRVRRALTLPADSVNNTSDKSASEVQTALANARTAVDQQTLSGVNPPHSAYEPRPSAGVGKLFDLVEKTVARVVEKI